VSTGSARPGEDPVVGFCDHGKDSSYPVKGWNLLINQVTFNFWGEVHG
jgi:hypothetical protein